MSNKDERGVVETVWCLIQMRCWICCSELHLLRMLATRIHSCLHFLLERDALECLEPHTSTSYGPQSNGYRGTKGSHLTHRGRQPCGVVLPQNPIPVVRAKARLCLRALLCLALSPSLSYFSFSLTDFC